MAGHEMMTRSAAELSSCTRLKRRVFPQPARGAEETTGMAIEVGRGVSGLDEMTVGAPRSAKEALQSGAISLDALRAAHRMRDGRSPVDVVLTLASFVAVPILFGWLHRWWMFASLALSSIPNFNCAAQLS